MGKAHSSDEARVLNISDVTPRTLLAEANSEAAVEASLYSLTLKTVRSVAG